jgi:hypothetical protein
LTTLMRDCHTSTQGQKTPRRRKPSTRSGQASIQHSRFPMKTAPNILPHRVGSRRAHQECVVRPHTFGPGNLEEPIPHEAKSTGSTDPRPLLQLSKSTFARLRRPCYIGNRGEPCILPFSKAASRGHEHLFRASVPASQTRGSGAGGGPQCRCLV